MSPGLVAAAGQIDEQPNSGKKHPVYSAQHLLPESGQHAPEQHVVPAGHLLSYRITPSEPQTATRQGSVGSGQSAQVPDEEQPCSSEQHEDPCVPLQQ